VIYALIDQRDGAIEQLRAVLAIPSPISPGLLRVDPTWASLRGDPRFQQLANQPPPTQDH